MMTRGGPSVVLTLLALLLVFVISHHYLEIHEIHFLS